MSENLPERMAALERKLARMQEQLDRLVPPERDVEKPVQSEPAPPPLPRAVTRAVPPRVPREESIPNVVRPATPDLRAALRRWKLWPPEGEGDLEVQAGAWWATRVGALLAVIGIVFFGIYVVHGTPPWVRFLELAGAAFGVTALGQWLERREKRFGSVIFGSGLALIFFTGFAAYAVPAVRIMDQPVAAVVVQAGIVLAIVGVSIWKNRSELATMAILFGFVTCLFSFFEQLRNMSLIAAFLLAVAGAALWLSQRWLLPFACSVPGAYVIYGFMVSVGWAAAAPEHWTFVVAFPVATFALFTATDFAALQRKLTLKSRERHFLQGCNAAASVGLGLLATHRYFGDRIVSFYGLFSALFLTSAYFYFRRDREDDYGSIWFAAGMGLLALALIEILDARTRWVVLAVQSLIALYTARRTRLWTGEAVMGVLWLASAGLFLWDTWKSGFIGGAGNAASLWGATAAGYLLLSGILLSLQARWFAERPVGPEVDENDPWGRAKRAEARCQLNTLYGVCLGGVACAAVVAGFSLIHWPSGALLVGLLLLGCAVCVRHWVALVGAACLFVFGQISFWCWGYGAESGWAVWLNGVVVIASAVAVVAGTSTAERSGKLPEEAVRWGAALHGFWLISLQVLLFKVASFEVHLFIAACAGLIVLGLAGWRERDQLADLFVAPVALAWTWAVLAQAGGARYLLADGGSVWLWAAVIAMLAGACLSEGWDRLGGLARARPPAMFARVVGEGTVTVSVLYLLARQFDLPAIMGAMGVGGLLILLLGRWPGWRGGVFSGVAVILAGHVLLLISLALERGGELFWTVILAGATLAAAVQAGDERVVRRIGVARSLQWLLGISATVSLFLLFLTRTGAIEPYTTALWGVSAIAVFASGLVWRVKPLRVVGLLGLAACLPRVFLVDIRSAFYRIAAFVVVGVVLLIVGFLYHRFRHYISDGGEEMKKEKGKMKNEES